MELNWLQSLLFGLVSGLTEFIPVSSDGHRQLFLYFLGAETEFGLLVFIRIGCLMSVVICCHKQLQRLLREQKIAAVPKKRRKRAPDLRYVLTTRLAYKAIVPLLFGLAAYFFLAGLLSQLWILALILVLNGIVLYLPQRYPSANKDALSLSALDALIIGVFGALGSVPGCSRVGFITSAGSLRGGDRRYILDFCLLISLPVLFGLSVLDGIAFFKMETVAFSTLLRYFCSGLSAFGGGCLGILAIRFMAWKAGLSGFAYYNWGLALFVFILYLLI